MAVYIFECYIGVCNSTLEEVFLRLVKSQKAVTEGSEVQGNSNRKITLYTKNHVPIIGIILLQAWIHSFIETHHHL